MYKPGDRKYKNEWFPINEKKPPCYGRYMVTMIINSVYASHEAIYLTSSEIFVDPIEEWEEYKNVIAWSYMPQPFIPNLQIPMEIK